MFPTHDRRQEVVLQPHPSEGKDVHHFWDNRRGRVISEGVVHVSDKVTLKRVALVKSLGFILLSVSQLLDEGFEVRFKSGESRLLDSRGDLVCMIIPRGSDFQG
jgi:hypothetical protein